MRHPRLFASSLALALALAGGDAAADIYEPNNVTYAPTGQLVPQPAPANEQSLNVFFTTVVNEAIDWRADAAVTPDAFSPLCGFTAKFVLNQAGSHFGLAWYNETGTPPPASDLHVLLNAGAPVGTMFNGTAIKNDPAYTGGLVGFALVGGETHYTNKAYDNLCSDTTVCNPAATWITALMYASKNTPNAYYICFEDGGTGANSWNNDGDFNDDVFFLTGITCAGGGQPCDTGMQGICASGVTQCTATGTTCQQVTQPTTETCNGLDDDCNGMVDDGAVCPAGEVCDKGMCVQACGTGEFPCPPNLVCATNGYCVDPACESVTCPAGQVCIAGTCKGPCDGVVCPYGQVCRVGVCLDPCAGVSCPSGEVCDNGACVQSCTCLPCPTGKSCDSTSGLCLDPACVGKTCGAGTHCAAGTCVPDCTGAACPTGETCTSGNCVMSAGSSSSSSSSGLVFGNGGSTASGGGPDGGSGASGTGGTGGSGFGGSLFPTKKSGCGCRVPGDDGGSTAGLLGLAGLAVAVAAARRKRS